ncbi:MAG: hypothetical protein CMA05_04830 [Euryarchaeota archaeon]|nr:hypothetical protein [Euryarchaeota archaeon]
MGKTYYTYEGKKKALGKLSAMFNELVLVEDEWVSAVQKQFNQRGYQHLLTFVKKVVRMELSVDLTDAQAWLVIHDLTNDGVPMALRDAESDEDANAAQILKGAMASVANTMMTPVDATLQAVQKPFKKSKSEQIEQELPVDEPVEE